MNRTVDATSHEQRFIRGIDDRVDSKRRDIGPHNEKFNCPVERDVTSTAGQYLRLCQPPSGFVQEIIGGTMRKFPRFARICR